MKKDPDFGELNAEENLAEPAAEKPGMFPEMSLQDFDDEDDELEFEDDPYYTDVVSRNKPAYWFFLSVPGLVAVMTVAAFLVQFFYYQKAEREISNLYNEIANTEFSLENINVSNLAFATKNLNEIFQKKYLIAMTQKYRQYQLFVDETEITAESAGTVHVEAESVTVSIIETAVTSSFPYSIETYGSLTDRNQKLENLVTVEGKKPVVVTGGNVTNVKFELTGQPGQKIEVRIASPLHNRLFGEEGETLTIVFE